MENHHVERENQLSMAIVNSFLYVYQAGYIPMHGTVSTVRS